MSTITFSIKHSILVSVCLSGAFLSPLVSSPAYASVALSDYDAAVATKATTADDFYNRGIYFQGQGKLETAIEQFNQAIAIDASNPDFYFSRGLTYTDRGDHQAAHRDYSSALKLDSSFAAAYYQRALSQMVIPVSSVTNLNQPSMSSERRAQVSNAIEDFSMALHHAPDFVAAHYYRGLSHYVMGHESLAWQDYQQARNLNPQIAETFYRQGFKQTYIGGPQERQ